VPASSSEDGEEETGGDVDLARDYSDGGSLAGWECKGMVRRAKDKLSVWDVV